MQLCVGQCLLLADWYGYYSRQQQKNTRIDDWIKWKRTTTKWTNERTMDRKPFYTINGYYLIIGGYTLLNCTIRDGNAAHRTQNVHVIHGLLLCIVLSIADAAGLLDALVQLPACDFLWWHSEIARASYCVLSSKAHTDRSIHIVLLEYLVNFHYLFCIRENCIWFINCIVVHDDEHNKRFGNLRIDLLIEEKLK